MIDLIHLKGKFITFEGGEGSGKTKLSNKLFEEFIEQKLPVVLTHDPGGTSISEAIRRIVLSKDSKVGTYAEMLLFAAARAQLTADVILPALEAGKTVICDRFLISTLVYQGALRGHDSAILRTIFEYTCNVNSDLIILLNVDAEIGLKRSYKVLNNKNVDESKFEDYGISFHKKVNNAFLALADEEYLYPPNEHLNRIKIVNANKSIEHSYNKMMQYLEEYSESLLNKKCYIQKD